MKITERYASSINSSNLKSKVETTYSDTDVLTAYGLAARHHPLGVALQRLFVDGKASDCVNQMAKMARDYSFRIKARACGDCIHKRSIEFRGEVVHHCIYKRHQYRKRCEMYEVKKD